MILEDRFFTSTEVAEILGVSLRSVYRYLEEDKIKADVKTATGRHRFTRQNILDFLYPEGQPQGSNEDKKSTTVSQAPVSTTSVPTPVVESNTSENNQDEEVDWLAKFRAAAQKHREEVSSNTETMPNTSKSIENTSASVSSSSVQAPQESPVQQTVSTPASQIPVQNVPNTESKQESHTQSIGSLSGVNTTVQETFETTVETPSQNVYYYTSGVGGLKELAQEINKSARKANVPYAFTMNAGLSLHKLIRPFSVLHIYSNEHDRAYFEKALDLSHTDSGSAQLVIYIDRAGVLNNVNEVHGLKVVPNPKLKEDLLAAGEVDLASEL